MIGEVIRESRTKYGMSQAELARRVKVSMQSMNELEQGHTKNPGFALVARIALVLGMDLNDVAQAVLQPKE